VPSCRCGHERHTGRPGTGHAPVCNCPPPSAGHILTTTATSGARTWAKFTSEPRQWAYLQRREGKRAARRRRRTHADRPGMPPPPGELLFSTSAAFESRRPLARVRFFLPHNFEMRHASNTHARTMAWHTPRSDVVGPLDGAGERYACAGCVPSSLAAVGAPVGSRSHAPARRALRG
jgi:hypothetical protein